MGADRNQIVVDITLNASDALVAYEEALLDGASSLRLDHRTGALTAVVPSGGRPRAVGCGTVATGLSDRLKAFRSVLMSRLDGDSIITVFEIPLEHVA
jgi:hypothetical protein